MIKHVFVFENGVAKIKDSKTGETQLEQPGLPGPEGMTPWASEEEANAWIHHQFDYYFIDIPSADDEQPPAEEQPPQEGSGA